MKINAKILKFFHDKGIQKSEIAESYGGTTQNIWNILNRESGKVPMDFLVWLANHYPQLDMNALLQEDEDGYVVRESKADYGTKSDVKDEMLKDISKILDKYL